MSNRDYSHTTLSGQKGAQTQFAGYIAAVSDTLSTPGLVRMGGGATASTAIDTALGATVAGATPAGQARPLATQKTTYSLAKTILAAARNG